MKIKTCAFFIGCMTLLGGALVSADYDKPVPLYYNSIAVIENTVALYDNSTPVLYNLVASSATQPYSERIQNESSKEVLNAYDNMRLEETDVDASIRAFPSLVTISNRALMFLTLLYLSFSVIQSVLDFAFISIPVIRSLMLKYSLVTTPVVMSVNRMLRADGRNELQYKRGSKDGSNGEEVVNKDQTQNTSNQTERKVTINDVYTEVIKDKTVSFILIGVILCLLVSNYLLDWVPKVLDTLL